MENIDEIMYTVGQIAGCIYPWRRGENDWVDLPENIMDQLLSRPLTGIGMLNARPEFMAADKENLGRLFDKLHADFENPEGGVPIEHQMPFWLGYYHYKHAKQEYPRLSREDFMRAGEALYGQRWQSDIARDLDVDSRRVREWVSNERKIPVGIWVDVMALLRNRQLDIDTLRKQIESGASPGDQ